MSIPFILLKIRIKNIELLKHYLFNAIIILKLVLMRLGGFHGRIFKRYRNCATSCNEDN